MPVNPPDAISRPPALLTSPVKLARPLASTSVPAPEMLPAKIVAPVLVELAPPPWTLRLVFSVMLPLRVCDPVVLLSGDSVGRRPNRFSEAPAAVVAPLSTMIGRLMTALAAAVEIDSVGLAGSRFASLADTPNVIGPVPDRVAVPMLSVPR